VARHFAGVITGDVERFELPNLHALNFLLHGALDGGGTLSLKTDAQGKVYSTAMLRMFIDVPDDEALPYEVRFEPPSPAFREVWLPLPVVDRHATSVVIHEWDGSHVWPGGEAFGP